MQLKLVPVMVYRYDALTLSTDKVDALYRPGNTKSTVVQVIEGNGRYTVTSSDEDLVKATISGDQITVVIQGKKEGEAALTITDACGREITLPVKATITVIPYDDDFLATILATSVNNRFVFGGTTGSTSYTYVKTVVDGMNRWGYTYSSTRELSVYFPIDDLSVGERTGCKVLFKSVPTGISSVGIVPLNYFKIIKKDGARIWAVFSVLHTNGTLYSGYFIQSQ
jgi:hypothetical protein